MINYAELDKLVTYLAEKIEIVNGEYSTYSECIHQMAKAQMTHQQIADRFKVRRTTILCHLRRMGVVRNKRSPGKECLPQLKELYQSGLSCRQVGALLDMTGSRVAYWLNAGGVPRRGRGRGTSVPGRNNVTHTHTL